MAVSEQAKKNLVLIQMRVPRKEADWLRHRAIDERGHPVHVVLRLIREEMGRVQVGSKERVAS